MGSGSLLSDTHLPLWSAEAWPQRRDAFLSRRLVRADQRDEETPSFLLPSLRNSLSSSRVPLPDNVDEYPETSPQGVRPSRESRWTPASMHFWSLSLALGTPSLPISLPSSGACPIPARCRPRGKRGP